MTDQGKRRVTVWCLRWTRGRRVEKGHGNRFNDILVIFSFFSNDSIDGLRHRHYFYTWVTVGTGSSMRNISGRRFRYSHDSGDGHEE